MSDADRDLLLRLRDGVVSGDVLAREAGQTRAAVWKRIEALRASGVGIVARPGRGYALEQPVDLLDAGRIRGLLSAETMALLAELDVAWSVDSTNAELLRRQAPAAGTDVLMAERQTAGRGRRGREWASPLAANLYLSASRLFAGGLARLGGLSLVAGVAVAQALHGLGFRAVQLKWPNDLVVADPGVAGGLRKLGGLLVEGGGEHAGPVRAVVGIGLNIRMPPSAAGVIGQPWIDLASLDAALRPDRDALAAAVLERLLPALSRFDAAGLGPFLEAYATCDALAGKAVDVQTGRGVVAGTCLGVAADGALRILDGDGERSFHAGEVSVRASGEAAP
ncbi:bifunctional biotin--[acetyl-CoA-carboxylase] ligase/biotin operon repressor BirA [Luteimonas vadosa]|uniref:Bifunctional ligase/repressor BirA n=1 Tax=Luteimonas vadosa TaxID=1165507 RepID=A0ABP9DRP7_9GAMM